MNKKIKFFSILLVSITVFVFTFFIMQPNEKSKLIQVNAGTTLSNQKICWGIKRVANHAQPDLGSKNKNVIDTYQGIAMGNKDKKYVYLTFDEGYEAGYTPKILEVLKQNNVKAAFFITAHFVNTQEQLVKQMIDDGHIVRKPHSKSSKYARNNRRKSKNRSNELTYKHIPKI